MASTAKVTKLFQGWKKDLEKHTKVAKTTYKKLEKKNLPLMIFSNITRNGMMSLTFNQNILVPSFIKKISHQSAGSDDSHRHLDSHLDIDTIDVSQIIDLKFLLKSDTNPDEIKYSLELMEWNDKVIQVFINFTNPLLISQG